MRFPMTTISLLALAGGMCLIATPKLAYAQPGTVLFHQKISDTEGGFTGTLANFDFFGRSVASLGDLDGDGVADLAVGANGDDDAGTDHGAVWILFLERDGTVRSHQKIIDTQFRFGGSIASLGDLDGDSVGDLAVGAPGDDDGSRGPCDMVPSCSRGAVWILFLNPDGTVKSKQKISDTQGGFGGILDDLDTFGKSVASLGDLDGDGVGDLAVGAPQDDDGGNSQGAVWVLFLNSNGTVKSEQKISATAGGFDGILDGSHQFGWSVASLGDLDGDGVGDLAVGVWRGNDGGPSRGAVWVLFLNSDGTVKAHQKISDTQGGFDGTLEDLDLFGVSVDSLGDLDGDSVSDIAVGALGDHSGGNRTGAVWILFLNTDGTVKSEQKISDAQGGFTGTLDDFDGFGTSVTPLGDLNGDGMADLVVGALGDEDGGTNRGAVWVLFLDGIAANCDGDDDDGQATICHIPPGNPDNARTITVSANALPAHLAHGDHCGPCGE